MAAARLILDAIGADKHADGLKDTPARFARWWTEFLNPSCERLTTSFPSTHQGQMVVVGPFRAWSVCEHHLLPFWIDLTIGYVPQDRVLGLSKLVRIGQFESAQLQIQERLVEAIATHVANAAGTPDVAVMGRGVHLCCLMRGARTFAPMTTSALRGGFLEDGATRQEFFSLASQQSIGE